MGGFATGTAKIINFHKYITSFTKFYSIRIDFSPKTKLYSIKLPTSKTITDSHYATLPTLSTFSVELTSTSVSCVRQN